MGRQNLIPCCPSHAKQSRPILSIPHSGAKRRLQLRRLDAILPQLNEGIPSPRIFMKMDTQGHDLSVFRGATGVLDKIVGLQSELPAVKIYDGMFSMSVALENYASCGFMPIGSYPGKYVPGHPDFP